MSDFLLELLSEEIPARMQDKAREDLARLFAAELAKAGLPAVATVTYATPRRLALIARDLPVATAAVSEEVKGPRTSAPPKALEGFLRKTGLRQEQLVDRDGVWFALIDRPGRATAEVLAEVIPAIIGAFPWPKSMRWGAASASTESARWVRPLHGIIAILGEDVLACESAGIASGVATLGHRFHHPGQITIGGAHDYVEKLRACHVIVDQDERRALIRDRAAALAAEAGLTLVADEGLVAENAGLTEWPVPLLGRFDAAFLAVPPEVIQLTARVNQKYFVCTDADGALADAFVCTANIEASDGGAAIVAGNQKVLAARLADARFFYEADLKVRLEPFSNRIEKLVFHSDLGTVADKVERVARLAQWLIEQQYVDAGQDQGAVTADSRGSASETASSPYVRLPAAPDDSASLARQAGLLAKADLVSSMVGEFPELQGVMGSYYAAAQGEDDRVVRAIRDHYKPIGPEDEVPTAPITVAVGLADKIDTLVAFFVASMAPTGSRDPFALRRAALGAIRLIVHNDVRIPLLSAFQAHVNRFRSRQAKWPSAELYKTSDYLEKHLSGIAVDDTSKVAVTTSLTAVAQDVWTRSFFENAANASSHCVELLDFFADRLKVQQREAGVRHDLIDAVFALGGEDDLVRLLARVRSLQAFMATADGASLLAGYKRAANILKKEGWTPPSNSRHPGLEPGSRSSATAEDGGTPAQGRGDGVEKPLSYTPDPVEQALIAALDAAEPAAADAVAREDFEGAMAALATLRAPIDAFFEGVTVNDPDPGKRASRLALLDRVRHAVHGVADFSKIEG